MSSNEKEIKSSVSYSKEVPVVGQYDVVVCGGGPGGIMSAIAAARSGAKVALIERYGFLGGMATAGLVNPISVFRYNNELVVGGLPWEFVGRLVEAGGAQVEYPLGNISIEAECYKIVAQRMVLEAGVTLYLHAYICGCEKSDDGKVTHVIFESKSGTQALAGKAFVDCTGDGDLMYMAGVPMQTFSEPLQPSSLCFIIGGVDTDKVEKTHHSQQGINYHNIPLQSMLRELAKTEDVPNFGGPWFCYMLRDGFLTVNVTRVQADMTDERQETMAECKLREDAHRMVKILREHSEPFKNAYIVETAPQAGVRETRHILGAHVLSAQEYLDGVNFEDSIARGCHPIDIHAANTSDQRCSFLKSAAYIPFRCLYAEGFPNLLTASRCLSADRVASASVRVMASVMGLGQAAGIAAAECASTGHSIADTDIASLRDRLIEWGAVL